VRYPLRSEEAVNIPLLTVERRWECLSCDFTDVTHEAQPHSRMHPCRGLRGLTTPMVPAGTKGKNVAHERGDYIGKDLVQLDGEGRPVMSIVTTRDEGEDATVFAPTATFGRDDL
jgi:hypothetical protein